MDTHFDIVIIGGGPAGSTCAGFLKKYRPDLSVLIIERERFPRDHVGESQLPVIGQVLDELGVWDKVEAANFPIKIGATYRWGRTKDLWDFEFLPDGKLQPESRPAKFVGQRKQTAFQVDRAVYDKILLDHAKELGATVWEETAVRVIEREDDRVTGLVLQDGRKITGRYYIDGSGHNGILRRAMGVEVDQPTNLQNIAIWDYWQNAEWAVTVGVGGTRVQVLSLGYGWIWFIPLGPTRTSIGLIVPAEYYKKSGKRPGELYREAIESDQVVSSLIQDATSENQLSSTKDWSFVSQRLAGDNWFLVGESCGFADPILAAGMSLAHIGARDVAYTIMAIEKGQYDSEWLRQRYCQNHRAQVGSHIRFADFWYTHNGVFTDLKDHTKEIVGDLGLDMTSDQAWRWFGRGGFIDQEAVGTGFGGYSLVATKHISANFLDGVIHYEITGKTHFKINLAEAEKTWGATTTNGELNRHRVYVRGAKRLPHAGLCGWLIGALREELSYEQLRDAVAIYMLQNGISEAMLSTFTQTLLETLEAMVSDGWIATRQVDGVPGMPPPAIELDNIIHLNRDVATKVPQTV